MGEVSSKGDGGRRVAALAGICVSGRKGPPPNAPPSPSPLGLVRPAGPLVILEVPDGQGLVLRRPRASLPGTGSQPTRRQGPQQAVLTGVPGGEGRRRAGCTHAPGHPLQARPVPGRLLPPVPPRARPGRERTVSGGTGRLCWSTGAGGWSGPGGGEEGVGFHSPFEGDTTRAPEGTWELYEVQRTNLNIHIARPTRGQL